MNIIDTIFRGFRSKKAKIHTFPTKAYKDGKYHISKHCIKRMNERYISIGDLHINLHTKPLLNSRVRLDQYNRPSYSRYSKNKLVSEINPKTKTVCTVRKWSTKKYNKIIRSKKNGTKY